MRDIFKNRIKKILKLFDEFLYVKGIISDTKLMDSRIKKIIKEMNTCECGIVCNTEKVKKTVEKYCNKKLRPKNLVYKDSNSKYDKIFFLEFVSNDASDADEIFFQYKNENLIIQDQFAFYGNHMPIHSYRGIKYHVSREAQPPSHYGNGQYIFEIKKILQKFQKPITLMDMCAGQGSIGFSLLNESEIIEHLVSVEIYSKQIEDMKKTIKSNNLPENKIELIESDSLDNVPEGIKVDLVVCNPPHSNKKPKNWSQLGGGDENWNFHKRFLSKISEHVTEGGLVTLLERSDASDLKIFQYMLSDDLVVVDTKYFKNTDWYMITIQKKTNTKSH